MKRFYLLLCVWLFFLPVAAQELRVENVQAPQKVKFAEPFDVTFTAVYPQGYTVALDEEKTSPDFAVFRTEKQTAQDGEMFSLSVRPYTLNISTFTVTLSLVQDGENVAQQEVQVPLTVEPVKLFKDNELREIRDPRVPLSWFLLLLIALAAAALVALIYFLTREKKQAKSPALSVPVDTRPSHVIALSQINALIDSGLWENKQYKIFYITLSDILREYLWRRFHIDTSADTSAELLKRAKRTEALVALVPQLREFLSSGDLVKFAKVVPTEAKRNADIILLQNMIKQTTPLPPQTKEADK